MGTKDSVQGILKVYAPEALNGTMDALAANVTTLAPTTIKSWATQFAAELHN